MVSGKGKDKDIVAKRALNLNSKGIMSAETLVILIATILLVGFLVYTVAVKIIGGALS